MLAQLELSLVADGGEITYRKASRLQGVLMERISTEYAERLHEQNVHPYSQSLILNGHDVAWRVCALNEEAYQQVIIPLLSEKFTSFQFANGMQVRIKDKKCSKITEEELLSKSSISKGKTDINLNFLTPTSFRRHGTYTLFPEPFLLYQSALNRINAVSDLKISEAEDILEELSQDTLVKRYSLHTALFPEEGINIPGFTGTFTMEVHDRSDETSLALYLMRFGTYSGIGIKTGMGMGSIKLSEGVELTRRKRT